MLSNKVLNIGLITLLSSAPILFSSSAQAVCSGSKCNGGDPNTNGCNEGAYTFNQTTSSYFDWGWKTIVIELRYSDKCQAVWTKAGRLKANDSSIWVQTEDGKQDSFYSPSKNGTYYSNMRQKQKGIKACARVGSQTWCTAGMSK